MITARARGTLGSWAALPGANGTRDADRWHLYRAATRLHAGALTSAEHDTLATFIAALPPARLGGDRTLLTPLLAAFGAAPYPDGHTQVLTRRAHLHVTTLGRMGVTLDGAPVHLPFAKTGELLVYLALHGPFRRHQVVDALWDGSGEARHVGYFKVTARKLRAALQGPLPFNPLPFEQGEYRLAPELHVTVDADALRAAFDAYSGPFLPAAEGEWVEAERARLHEAALLAGLRLLEAVRADDPGGAVRVGERLVSLDPLHKGAHLALLGALEHAGDRAGLSGAYRTYARMLHAEYGTAPGADVQRRFGLSASA
ncbi:AfsR/SARP family transcriptional regulator [Deinococcus maricopensis]|uniref:AfsR/SARP family transcriptional regulator n=1 Tax=Deinococcus maricopensis TaxID=309887 RepID=UPI0002EA90AD|nr:BTAD domain-containing putative transcriptional regulator [Deinococcus maricopensis]